MPEKGRRSMRPWTPQQMQARIARERAKIERMQGQRAKVQARTKAIKKATAKLREQGLAPTPGVPVVPKRERLKCGAKCRDGHACQASPVAGRRRCRMHGGASTGPKTPEGRQRIREAQWRRALMRLVEKEKARLLEEHRARRGQVASEFAAELRAMVQRT